MENRRFSLLVSEFIQFTQGTVMKVKLGEALSCQYGERQCRIEDAERVGLANQLLILVEIPELTTRSELALHLNGEFHLSSDGYLARLSNGAFYFIRHRPITEYPQELVRYLSESVKIVECLSTEIKDYVVD
ncbi:hypothetical protein NTE25_003592 [Vibrio cholerae]|uniref:hypothetical protein n=2 Tax=Vibrio cholerae TaxID=666 RepID=UPI000E0C91D4|nr:hypothetical protein [Vibrio cholerae]EGQ7639652.1 hypothetical protein [Vibrio cholerae]EGQ7944641.1 hypothetical protein [Vibrio cholerae]EGQ9205294.1 hypothetical protein [Vibrio cholerae]EGQ9332299.1 hypothetical protein [Vibrio cholerae]EHE6925644.1 hypothetical protein [Vibrio cholerae]